MRQNEKNRPRKRVFKRKTLMNKERVLRAMHGFAKSRFQPCP